MATSDSSLSDCAMPDEPALGPKGTESAPKKGPPPLPPKAKAPKSPKSSAAENGEEAKQPKKPGPKRKAHLKSAASVSSISVKGHPARPMKAGSTLRPPTVNEERPPKFHEPPREEISRAKTAQRQRRALEEEADEEDAEDTESEEVRRTFGAWVQNSTAMMVSMIAHMAVLLLLGLWMLPSIEEEFTNVLLVNPSNEETAEEELTTELESPLEEVSMEVTSATNAIADGVAAAHASISNAPSLDQSVAEQIQGVNVNLDGPPIKVPGPTSLVSALPQGQVGEARAIVDNYDEALDRITQEILMMLAESKVLVVWCFDESESMKDDQQEIRDRIDHVYTELGLKDAAHGDALLTSICSYGSKFTMRTSQPTSKLIDIKDAIDEIAIEPSGLENMCSAVGQAITVHSGFAKGGHRQMALILVTDESGEHEDNNLYVEPMVKAAVAAKCRVYTLGREAVFGYPYAHISWRHPQTGHVHWLPINRGPETGFVEQLQTECFRRRYDAHSSGFGPYEQVRLAQQTGGIFFMLPSLESKLVRGEKRRYQLEAMRAYLPDIRSREDLWKDANASRFRSVILKIINDLNPYRPEIAKAMEVRFEFSADPQTFFKQVEQEQEKAKQYVLYLDAAAKALQDIQPLRVQEYSPRWQANYDVIYAQVLAYTARTYEYGAYLEKFKHNPKKVPLDIPEKKHRLAEWHIRESKTITAPDVSNSYIERASAMFQDVIKQHPGTPWAARADWELKRGFGVELQEVYHYYGPRPPQPNRPQPPRVPIPKL